MAQYVVFKYDWQIIEHDVNVDFNDKRVLRHIRALIGGYGSSTENIMIDFVKGQYNSISIYDTVQSAWDRLDEDQKEFVFAFRNIMSCPILGEKTKFPHLFFIELVRNEYLRLCDIYEDSNGEDSLSIVIKKKLVEKAEKLIEKSLGSEIKEPIWVIEQDEVD